MVDGGKVRQRMSTETWLLLGLLVLAPAYCWAVSWAPTPALFRPQIVRNGAVLFTAIFVALSGVIGVAALGVLYTSYGWWFLAVCAALSIFSAWSALPRSAHKSEEQVFSEKRTTSEAETIITDEQSKAVQHLIKMGDLEYLRIFIRANPRSLNYLHPPDHFTLLHMLASLGNKTRPVHAKMVEELLVNGADVNCRTDLGWTPIHIIAMQGQKEARSLARLLIAHGADLTATDRMGFDWKMHWKHGIEIRREQEQRN
jgi:hypothetical protein